jgi:hypothetical protein
MCRLDGSTVGCLGSVWLLGVFYRGKKQVPERGFLDEFFPMKYL